MAGSSSQRQSAICVAWLAAAVLLHFGAVAVFPQNVQRLLDSTAKVRAMDEASLRKLVPQQSGLQYIDCPNCSAGRQERQLVWTIEKPDEVACQFCGHHYPSEKYPMRDAVVVHTPRGKTARFEYWADANGYRYFFKARRDDEVRKYLSQQTLNLARLYAATKDKAHAQRAAVILNRFAEVFPNWCYHYDYPFQQKEIYDGDVYPAEFRNGFRTARWNWWAYHDIPDDLVEAFQLIRGSGVFDEMSKTSGVNVAERIQVDLLRNAGEQVLANRDEFTNMSPGTWSELVHLGRVLDEPRYVHEVVRRFKRRVESQFFYDGFWCEGSPSYSKQTVGALQNFLRDVKGYSDPPGVIDPVDKARFDNLDLEREYPLLRQARAAQDKLKFPNGRLVPVHDTWAVAERSSPVENAESYLLPALGHACLMAGVGPRRAEFHLSWSGGYGHQHADILSLLLFADGRELLSDLGYTHTAYRSWTLATAAHNTVVIDGLSQESGSRNSPTDGSLRFMDLTNPRVQVVRADGGRAYPKAAKKYVRTLVVIDAGEQQRYAVDVFDVEGGATHDYFLHGDADTPTTVSTKLELNDLKTLLPADFDWKPTKNEGESGRVFRGQYAYGFLTKLRSVSVPDKEPVQVDFQVPGRNPATLRATLFPEPNSELVLGENPSIRQADEDDSQLGKFNRPFLMLRHRADQGPSRFAAVLEPSGTAPFITSARRLESPDGATVLEIRIGDRVDVVVIGAKTPQSIGLVDVKKTARFQGEVGVFSSRGRDLAFAYALGQGGWRSEGFELSSQGTQRAPLIGLQQGTLLVDAAGVTAPKAGDVVRLATADGWVYPFNVTSTAVEENGRQLRIDVAEGPGMEFDAVGKQLDLKAFPQRSHTGPVHVEWLSSASSSAQPASK